MQLRALDALPLFADDEAIGAAVLGVQRAGDWPGIASLLERRGLPKIDPFMGGRYVPAVKAFFDRENGIAEDGPMTPDGVEDLGAWKKRKRHRA
jgi:hypothetical protein